MATSNNRDVKMTLSVETLGVDDIKKLQNSILALADGAGDAAPEFERLAAEVGRLGEQADALRQLQALGDEVQQLAQRQEAAAAASTQMRERLDGLKAATQQAAQNQREAADAFTTTKNRLTEITGELAGLRASYDAAGKKTDEYKGKLTGLIGEQTELRKQLDQEKVARTEANRALAEAEKAQERAATAYSRTNDALVESNRALERQQATLNQVGQDLEQFGLSSADAAASQVKLVNALNQAGKAAQETRASIDAIAAAERELTEQSERAAAALADRVRANKTAYEQEQAAAKESAQIAAQRAAAEQKAAQESIAAKRAEQAESDRLAAIVIANRERMEAAGRQQLLAELAAQRDAAASAERYEQQKVESIKRAAAEAAAATKAAAQAIDNAFGTLGVRSVDQLEREILEVRQAMQLVQAQSGQTGAALASAMSAGQARIEALQRELREVRNELTFADKAAGLLKNSMGQIAAGNLIADGIGYLVNKVKEMGQAFVQAQIQAETMRRGLTALYGSSETAAAQIDFLQKTAVRAGIAVGGISDSFVRFSASTKNSNIPLEQTNALFAAVTQAGATLGLSSERVTLALDALGQMASKGVVSMEELRQQLGDSLPGALSLTAKGLGITDAQLIKLVESGQLAARDLFPALTRGLKDLQVTTDGLQATWDRFKTTMTLVAQSAGDAGWATVLTGALKVLGGLVASVGLGLSVLSETLFTAGKAALLLFETLRGNGKEAFEFFSQEVDKSIDRLDKQGRAFNAMLDPAQAAAASVTSVADASTQTATAATAATAAVTAQTAAMAGSTEAMAGYATSAQASAAAAKILSDAQLDSSQKAIQLKVTFTELVAQQEQQAVLSGKLVKAAQDEAAAIENLAKLRGDEVSAQQASVQAAQITLAALEREARDRETLATTLATQVAETRKLIIEQTGSVDAANRETEAINKKLIAAQGEAEQARQAVVNARAEIAARQQLSDTYRDNSARVDELRVAYVLARVELEKVRALFNEGRASAERLSAAQEALAKAAGLVRDAQNDVVEATTRKIQIQAAENNLIRAGLEVKLAEARAAQQIAILKGDEAAASRALAQQKQIEADITRLGTQAKRAEVEATIAMLERQKAELDASDPLVQKKREELDLRILNEKAKLAEAKAGEAVVRTLEAERDAINRRNSAASKAPSSYGGGSSVSGGTSSYGGGSTAPMTSQDPYGRSAYQQNLLRQQGGPVDASYVFGLKQRLESGGTFTKDELPAILNALNIAKQNARLGAPGSVSLEGRRDDQMWINILQRIVDQIQGMNTMPSATTPTKGAYTVNVNLNGETTPVGMASAKDADNLAAIFKSLEAGKGTAG